MAEIEPTFGGLYFDRGTLHVVLTDVNRNPAVVRRAITMVFNDARLKTLPIHIEAGIYSFSQLAGWGRSLPKAFTVPGVVSIDIDEVRNRLAIGITSLESRAAAQAVLLGAGIPSAVLRFDVRPANHLTQSLGGDVRNIVGGVHLDFAAGGAWCTLGLNVSYGGAASFMTNGHCSSSWGSSNDGTPFYQAFHTVSADSVGAEGTESALFGSGRDSRCPSSASICKYSDVDFVSYRSGMITSQSMGYFGRPTTRSRFDSNLVINSATPTIPITSKVLFPFAGDTVDKVGARTGWTYGPVTSTCTTEAAGNGVITYYFVCTHTANMAVGPGDSGSGVFSYDGSANGSWAGQVFAGYSPGVNGFYQYTLFAPLNNIQSEFGSILATIYGT